MIDTSNYQIGEHKNGWRNFENDDKISKMRGLL
jgi:hypothetical protein